MLLQDLTLLLNESELIELVPLSLVIELIANDIFGEV